MHLKCILGTQRWWAWPDAPLPRGDCPGLLPAPVRVACPSQMCAAAGAPVTSGKPSRARSGCAPRWPAACNTLGSLRPQLFFLERRGGGKGAEEPGNGPCPGVPPAGSVAAAEAPRPQGRTAASLEAAHCGVSVIPEVRGTVERRGAVPRSGPRCHFLPAVPAVPGTRLHPRPPPAAL